MLKTRAVLEVKIGERVYMLSLPSDSPLGEVHDALFQMRTFIIEKINAAQEADKQKEVVEPQVEVV